VESEILVKKEFHIDLNMTNQCNLRCSYCIEAGKYNSKNNQALMPRFYAWIDKFLESDFFKDNYTRLHLAPWGGEPTLESDSIAELISRYAGDPRVQFMLYSNGYSMPDNLKSVILEATQKHNENPSRYTNFSLQVSYDGQPIHDICRRTISGKPTSEQVLKTIRWAQENQIDHSVKSTITVNTLKHLHEAWKDIDAISKGEYLYFPTVDYFNPISPEQLAAFDTYLEDMKSGMKAIAVDTLKAKREGRKVSGFQWFRDIRDRCAAGILLYGLDTDGKFYSCHTALYSEAKLDHLIGTLDDDYSIFTDSASKHPRTRPVECQSCEAVFCISCNVNKYRISKKAGFGERWVDYTASEHNCRIYKEMGKVTRAYLQLKGSNVKG
jgi:radical SAM protein with 4Fe4S-binding SPASM domain